jgi:hypothetical protein
MSTETDTKLIALGERFEKLLLKNPAAPAVKREEEEDWER